MNSINRCIFIDDINVCCMGDSPGDVSEEPVTLEKRKKDWRKSSGVGESTEGSENEV